MVKEVKVVSEGQKQLSFWREEVKEQQLVQNEIIERPKEM
jgi:hypothetical protein